MLSAQLEEQRQGLLRPRSGHWAPERDPLAITDKSQIGPGTVCNPKTQTYENSTPRGETSAQPERGKPHQGRLLRTKWEKDSSCGCWKRITLERLGDSPQDAEGRSHPVSVPPRTALGPSLKHSLSCAPASVPKVGPILPQALQTADGASRSTSVVCAQGGSGRGTGSPCLSWGSARVGSQTRNECGSLFGWWSQRTL